MSRAARALALAGRQNSSQESSPPPNREAAKAISYQKHSDTDKANLIPIYFPKIYIDRVILNTVELEPSPSKIAAELLLSAKIPQQKQYLNFLNSSYVEIKIIEVRNEKWKQLLQKSTEFIQKIVERKYEDINEIFTNLASQYELTTNVSLEQSFKEHCTIHYITDIPSINKISRTSELQSGEAALNYYFKHKTQLTETDHLSFFVYADYNKEEIEEKEGALNIGQESPQISAEMIINKGKICSLTYVFYDKNDVIWTGEIHERGPDGSGFGKGVWYKGKLSEYNSETAEILTRRPYYNTKIQDFRAILQIEKKLDLVNGLEKQKKMIDEYLVEKNNYNDVIYKQADCVVKFIRFGDTGPILQMGLEDFLKKYSKIYNFLNSKPTYDKNSVVKDTKAYKIRAKRLRSKGFAYPSTEQFIPFQKNQQKQYIDIESIETSTKEQLEFQVNDPEFNTEYGEYCYGIEFLVVDPLIDWLNKFIEKLRETNTDLEKYYSISKLEEYYDFGTNMFTDSFQEWYEGQKSKGVNLESVRATFFEALGYMGITKTERLETIIGLMTSPVAATPASVLYFINSMKHITGIFEKLYLDCRKERYIKIEKLYDNITERKRQQLRRMEISFDIGTTQQELQRFQDLTSATLLDQNGNPLMNGFYPIPTETLIKVESYRTRIEQSVQRGVSQPFENLQQTRKESSRSQRNIYVPPIKKKEVSSQKEQEEQKNTDRRYSQETKGGNSSNLQVDSAAMDEVLQRARRRG